MLRQPSSQTSSPQAETISGLIRRMVMPVSLAVDAHHDDHPLEDADLMGRKPQAVRRRRRSRPVLPPGRSVSRRRWDYRLALCAQHRVTQQASLASAAIISSRLRSEPLLASLLPGQYGRDRRLGEFHLDVLGDLQDHLVSSIPTTTPYIPPEVTTRSPLAMASEHLAMLLLALLLRPDQQEVEDHEDQDYRDRAEGRLRPGGSPARRLLGLHSEATEVPGCLTETSSPPVYRLASRALSRSRSDSFQSGNLSSRMAFLACLIYLLKISHAVQGRKPRGQHLPGLEEVPQVGPGEVGAGIAVALGIERREVVGVAPRS